MPALNLNSGTVYFLALEDKFDNRSLPFYKIGFTNGLVASRINQLQTGNPYRIIELDSFSSEAAQLIELYLHNTLAKNRVRLEWFQFTETEIKSAIKDAKNYNSKIHTMISDVRKYDGKESNGKTIAADERAMDLHEQALSLLNKKTTLGIREKTLKAHLEALTAESMGIMGITKVSVTKPRLSFKLKLFKERYSELYERLCTQSSLSPRFSIIGKPTIRDYPNERLELDKAKEQVVEITADDVQEIELPRAKAACDYHSEYLSTFSEKNLIESELKVIELELRYISAENEGIDGVCQYKRSLTYKLDRETLKSGYAREFEECCEVGQPTRRFRVLKSQDY